MKSIFVGNEQTYRALSSAQVRPQWDWQFPVPSIGAFWNAVDNGQLDESTAVIVISDEFYALARRHSSRQLMEDFLNLVYESTQTAVTFIVNYFPQTRQQMVADIQQYASKQQDPLRKFFWIDPQHPNPDLDRGVREYINMQTADPQVAALVASAEGLDIRPEETDAQDDDSDLDDLDLNDGLGSYTNNYGKDALLLCVTSSKGGVGKTSTTFGTSTWLAHSSQDAVKAGTLPKPLKICVVDLDVHDAQIGSMIGQSQPTILNIVMQPELNQQVVAKYLQHSERLGTHFLLAPKLPRTTDSISPAKYGQVIDILKKMFDVVIMDTSVAYTEELFSQVAYPKADKIVFVTTLDRKSIIGMGKWIYAVGGPASKGGAEIPMNRVNIVINQGMKGVDMPVSEIKKLIDVSVTRMYTELDRTVAPEDYLRPRIIGAIPEIQGGIITRLSNMQKFELTMNIPEYEKNIAGIARKLMPKAIAEVLPNVHDVK